MKPKIKDALLVITVLVIATALIIGFFICMEKWTVATMSIVMFLFCLAILGKDKHPENGHAEKHIG